MTAQKGWPADRPSPQSTEARSPELVLDYVSMLTPTGVKQAVPDFTFQGDQTYYIKGNYFLYGTTTLEGGAVLKFAKYDRTNDISLWIGGSLVCNTSPYRPAVFTACDDNTVGVTLPSTLSTGTVDPGAIYGVRGLGCWYGAPAWDVHDIRFIGQGYALYLGNQANNKIHNVQIASRGWAWTVGVHIAGNPASTTPYTNYVGNVLFSSLGAAIGYETPVGQTVTLDFENITSDNNYLFCPPSTESKFREVRIKNSLLGPLWNPVLTDAQYFPGTQFTDLGGNQVIRDRTAWASTFTTALAGKFYLPDASPLHGTGTQKGNAILYTDLATASTYAPQTLTAALTDGTTLPPRVARDVYVADPGYHYPALDYLVRNLPLNASANVSLVKGVSVGWSGPYAFTLQNGSSFSSRGLPDAMNHLVHHSLVQEAPPTVGAISTFVISPANTTPPKLSLRFTELASLGGRGNLVLPPSRSAGDPVITPLILADSLFGGMQFQYVPAPGYYPMVTVANNVFDRGYFGLHAGINGNAYLTAAIFNNTFYRLLSETGAGRFALNGVANQPAWQVIDNVFDGTPVQIQGTWTGTFDYNAFPNGTTYQGSHVITGTLSYTNGPLGRWYQVGTGFQDTGRRAAVFAGLAHHTTRADQTPEGISPVDPGFHYIATAYPGSTTPRDLNNNQLPDYLEDTDGDSLIDPVEIGQGTNPYDPYDPIPQRLAHWQFNRTDLTTDDGTPPSSKTAPIVDSYDGSAPSFTSPTHQLVYPVTWNNGNITFTNINFWNGTLRFVYIPSWYSNTRTSPGVWCRLFECGNWALCIPPDGKSIILQSPTTNGTIRTNIVAELPAKGPLVDGERVGWTIELSYSPSHAWIRVDGGPATNNEVGIQADLPTKVQATGLRIGSSANGAYCANGIIDEVETFNATVTWIPKVYAPLVGKLWDMTLRYSAPPTALDTGNGIQLTFARAWEGDWLKRPANYAISRRKYGESAWTQINTTPVTSSTWTDTTAEVGTYYEYRVERQPDAQFFRPTTVSARQGAIIPNRGQAILIIDQKLAESEAISVGVPQALESYKADLVSEGWTVREFYTPGTYDPPWYLPENRTAWKNSVLAVKTNIYNAYKSWSATNSSINVAVLIGRVPIPYSGTQAEDGHVPHEGAWPADAFYGDMSNFLWPDKLTGGCTNNCSRAALLNLPGDGAFDCNYLPPEADGSYGKLEVAVGRIDFGDLNGYWQDSKAVLPEPHTNAVLAHCQALKRYLDKIGRFRRGQIQYTNDWDAYIQNMDFHTVLDSTGPLQLSYYGTQTRSTSHFTNDAFELPLKKLFAFHGGYGSVGKIDPGHTGTRLITEAPGGVPQGMFFFVMGSHLPDWNQGGDFLRFCLGAPDSVVAISWVKGDGASGPIQSDALAMGLPMGATQKLLFDRVASKSVRANFILGDPTLRSEYLKPPLALSASVAFVGTTASTIVSWTPSQEATDGYAILRSPNSTTPNWSLLATVPATAVSFTNRSIASGSFLYNVLSIQKHVSGAGVFYKTSGGSVKTVTVK